MYTLANWTPEGASVSCVSWNNSGKVPVLFIVHITVTENKDIASTHSCCSPFILFVWRIIVGWKVNGYNFLTKLCFYRWEETNLQKRSCSSFWMYLLQHLSDKEIVWWREAARVPCRFHVVPIILLQEACCAARHARESWRRLINKVVEQQHRCWLRSLSWRD